MHKPISIARSSPGAWTALRGYWRIGAAFAAACLLLCACHEQPAAGAGTAPVPEAKSEDDAGAKKGADAKESGEGVALTPEQIEKMGIVTQPAHAIDYTEETAGYGVVISHDSIAQAVAELVTAQATGRLSRSALSRAKNLAGTPGAVSADVEETAAQKAAVDAAALTLTTQRLSSTLGMNPPWKNGNRDSILQELASGKVKLVRVTFPLGSLSGGTPKTLRATHIGASKPGTGWTLNAVWDAPSDASVPGRSFFALLKGSDAGEGERIQVWAPIGVAIPGAVIPAAAAVMSDGKYWCYLEKKPGTFVRTEIDTGKPTADGYFVTDGVSGGDKVVTSSVGQLLAKESASGAEPD